MISCFSHSPVFYSLERHAMCWFIPRLRIGGPHQILMAFLSHFKTVGHLEFKNSSLWMDFGTEVDLLFAHFSFSWRQNPNSAVVDVYDTSTVQSGEAPESFKLIEQRVYDGKQRFRISVIYKARSWRDIPAQIVKCVLQFSLNWSGARCALESGRSDDASSYSWGVLSPRCLLGFSVPLISALFSQFHPPTVSSEKKIGTWASFQRLPLLIFRHIEKSICCIQTLVSQFLVPQHKEMVFRFSTGLRLNDKCV